MQKFVGLLMRKRLGLTAVLSGATAMSVLAGVANASLIFSDTFSSGSTVDAAPATPTNASTSYEMISTKSRSPTPSIASGHLKFGIAATTSGVIEAQARFPAITLATASDSLEYTVTFTNTNGLLTQAGTLGFGLYNSGGVDAISGGLNGTATSSTTAHTTDGTVGWQGYVSQFAFSGGTSRVADRKIQNQGTVTDNAQDLVSFGSPSSSYSFPAGNAVGTSSGTSALTLTAGSIYTEDMLITLNGDGSETISDNLYSGNTVTGSPLATLSGIAATPLTQTYDAFALGWRATANTSATAIDVNGITINATIASTSPEPASLGALAIGGLALVTRRRRA